VRKREKGSQMVKEEGVMRSWNGLRIQFIGLTVPMGRRNKSLDAEVAKSGREDQWMLEKVVLLYLLRN